MIDVLGYNGLKSTGWICSLILLVYIFRINCEANVSEIRPHFILFTLQHLRSELGGWDGRRRRRVTVTEKLSQLVDRITLNRPKEKDLKWEIRFKKNFVCSERQKGVWVWKKKTISTRKCKGKKGEERTDGVGWDCSGARWDDQHVVTVCYW